jgi:hypothetical protein
MTNYNWITDRRPTEADGDKDGYVIARCDPDNNDVLTYLHWSHPHWERVRYRLIPWRHVEIRQSLTRAPEPTKPALAVGQCWRRRDGEVVTIQSYGNSFLAGEWVYIPDGTAPLLDDPRPELDLVELLPTAATPTPRKFASLSRTVTDFGHTIDAIDEDGVAWWMTLATDDSEPQWRQLLPLPGSEVVG